MSKHHPVSRKDCETVIKKLTDIFEKSGLLDEISFLVYGSYLGGWRDGVSDLDGIIYFHKHLPFDAAIRPKILTFQKEVSKLYEEIDFLKEGRFFADIHVLDYLHASDGRFLVFDKYFVPLNPDKAAGFGKEVGRKMFFGSDFIDSINPNLFLLINSKEKALATSLHKLRNYFFFELSKTVSEVSASFQKDIVKSLKILPRCVKFLLDEESVVSPENLNNVRIWLKDIDYSYLARFFDAYSNPETLNDFFDEWHQPGNQTFVGALECFEKTLERMVKNVPAKGIKKLQNS